MRLRPTHRLVTMCFMVMSLLFSQLAMASYRCPAAVDPSAIAHRMAAGMSCDGADPAQPALCHQHSADAAQSCEAVKVPAPTLALRVQMLELAFVPNTAATVPVAFASTPESRPPPDPLYLATLRLRV